MNNSGFLIGAIIGLFIIVLFDFDTDSKDTVYIDTESGEVLEVKSEQQNVEPAPREKSHTERFERTGNFAEDVGGLTEAFWLDMWDWFKWILVPIGAGLLFAITLGRINKAIRRA